MILHTYKNSSGKDLILDYINSLSQNEQVDAFHVLECMENGEMEKIQFKRWQKRVYEVYFKKHNRIFYIIADGEHIYLLHARKKQKNKTEKKDKDKVISRAKEIGDELNRKFI